MSGWGRTWIIGGGPSAKGLDVERLRGRGKILGINEAAFKVRCDAFFTIDRVWVAEGTWMGRPVYEHLRALVQTGTEVHLCSKLLPDKPWPVIPGAQIWKRILGPPKLDRTPYITTGLPHAAASGLSGIGLAPKFGGGQRTFLFGFDMNDQYGYWYEEGDKTAKQAPDSNIRVVRRNFWEHSRYYAEAGYKIFNASPGTALDCFPVISHEEAYNG